jgi:hypothetical protein
MTVTNEASSSTWNGNSVATVFALNFSALLPSEIQVFLTLSGGLQTLQVQGVAYTLSGDLPSGGGNVTFVTAPPIGSVVLIQRSVPYTQATSFRTQGSFSPVVHEQALDEAVFRDQQLSRRITALESVGPPVGAIVAGLGLNLAGNTMSVGNLGGINVGVGGIAVAWGAAGAMSQVTKAAASAGTATLAAPIDHKHDVSTAAPVAGAVVAGGAAAEGTATSIARSDHVHAVSVAAPTTLSVIANSAGVATTLARSDHQHDISTAAAVDLTDATSAAGASVSLARADHTHSHGARGGGTLHAVAVAGVSHGFMSLTDKAKLDGLTGSVEQISAIASIKTTDATPTTALIITPATNTNEVIEVTVVARKVGSGGGNGGGWKFITLVRNLDGTLTMYAVASEWIQTTVGDTALAATLVASSPNVNVVVTGEASVSFYWTVIAKRTAQSQ